MNTTPTDLAINLHTRLSLAADLARYLEPTADDADPLELTKRVESHLQEAIKATRALRRELSRQPAVN